MTQHRDILDVSSEDMEPVGRPPGFSEYEARCSIRRLIEEYGDLKATFLVSVLLEDEKMRTKQ